MAKPSFGKLSSKRETGGKNREFENLIKGGELEAISLDLVDRDPAQPRSLESVQKGIEDFAAEIKRDGLIQNPVYQPVDGGRYQVVVGERRTEAFRQNGETEIWAVIKSFSKDEKRRIQELQYAENDEKNRKPLNALEDARWWRNYIDSFFDGKQKGAADARGVTEAFVSKKLAPLKASQGVMDFIEEEGTRDVELVSSLIKLDKVNEDAACEWMDRAQGGKIDGSMRESVREELKSLINPAPANDESGEEQIDAFPGEGLDTEIASSPASKPTAKKAPAPEWPKAKEMDVCFTKDPGGNAVLVLSENGQRKFVVPINETQGDELYKQLEEL